MKQIRFGFIWTVFNQITPRKFAPLQSPSSQFKLACLLDSVNAEPVCKNVQNPRFLGFPDIWKDLLVEGTVSCQTLIRQNF